MSVVGPVRARATEYKYSVPTDGFDSDFLDCAPQDLLNREEVVTRDGSTSKPFVACL